MTSALDTTVLRVVPISPLPGGAHLAERKGQCGMDDAQPSVNLLADSVWEVGLSQPRGPWACPVPWEMDQMGPQARGEG